MAIPEKNDPRRPVALGVNAARVVGVIGIVVGAGVAALGIHKREWAIALACLLIYAAPALVMLILSPAMKRGQRSAVTAILVMAAFQAAVLVVGIVAMLGRTEVRYGAAPLMFVTAYAAALIALVVYCAQSYKVLHLVAASPHGFEPIMAVPVAGPSNVPWYYSSNEQVQGPVTFDALRIMVQTGALGPNDRVWNPTMPQWTSAREVGELSSVGVV